MKRLFLILALSAPCLSAEAQRFSLGTNAVDWMSLGTMNIEASAAVSRALSLYVGGGLNPWTFGEGNPQKQLQMRQGTIRAGARWWPWHIYSGWWMGADARYSVYNGGGIIGRETEEGDAWGGGLYGGYAIMLSDRWNLDLGAGVWGGGKVYTVYACPVCGVKTDAGTKAFILPDARIAIQMIF
jgi:hypothetical protein